MARVRSPTVVLGSARQLRPLAHPPGCRPPPPMPTSRAILLFLFWDIAAKTPNIEAFKRLLWQIPRRGSVDSSCHLSSIPRFPCGDGYTPRENQHYRGGS